MYYSEQVFIFIYIYTKYLYIYIFVCLRVNSLLNYLSMAGNITQITTIETIIVSVRPFKRFE